MWYLTVLVLMPSRAAISAFVPPFAQRVEDAPLGGRQDVGVARPAAAVALHGAIVERGVGRFPRPPRRLPGPAGREVAASACT